jgi:hypothetical protein
MVLNALCNVPLLVSHFHPVVQIGWMMPTMLFACAVGTLVLMPALLVAATEKPARRSLRGAVVAVLMTGAVLTTTAPAHAMDGDPAAAIASAWAAYRQVKTEEELLDMLVLATGDTVRFSRAEAERLLAAEERGVIRKRALRRVVYAEDGRDKIHVSFSLPKAEAGTALLVRRGEDAADDDQRLYLPALRTVRRVPPTDTQSFMGTTLSYEDVRLLAGERTERFAYKWGGVETFDDRVCDVIVAKPRPDTPTMYARRVVWLDRARHLPLKMQYFDERERLRKVFFAGNVREVAPGVHRADFIEMRDVASQHATLVMTKERRIGIEIPPYVFNPEYLVHPE